MSDAGDAASRLSSALDRIFSSSPVAEPETETEVASRVEPPNQRLSPPPTRSDWSVDDEPTTPMVPVDDLVPQPFDLPAIVPATESIPVVRPAPVAAPVAATVAPVVEPALPDRSMTPSDGLAPRSVSASVASPPVPARPATSWSDHMTTVPAGAQGLPLRSPGRKPRVRRVTRVLRHIDPWSTFKVALLFSAVAYVVLLTAGVLLWRVADSTGTLANIERWFTQFGWETFELKGGEVFHNAWILGMFAAAGLTGGIVLLATLFNLVSDIIGGVRMTVLEEEVVERTVSSTKRYVVRRPPTGTGGESSTSSSWSVDDGEDRGHHAGEPVESPPVASTPASPVSRAAATSPSAEWSVDD